MFESLNLNECTRYSLRRKFTDLRKAKGTKEEKYIYDCLCEYCEALEDTGLITWKQYTFIREIISQIYINRECRKGIY